jgi:TP901 family phage tail tape measure protein
MNPGAGGGLFLGSVYATMSLKSDGFARDVAEARAQVIGLGGAFGQSEASGNSFSSFLTGKLKTGLLAGGIAAAGAGTAAIHLAGDFEQSLSVLRYNSGATAAQFEQLSTRARELGKDASLPGVSASDAALAMNELAKAGLSVNDVLSASRGVLSLAKAGNIDVGLAATTTARALNAFSLEGREASRIADMLAAAANKSTADVQDLAYGLQMAGAGSKQMGVPLQDTITALSIFANAGIAGSDAGTSLKTMFQTLANPTKESAALMRKLGLDFFDAQGRFVGLESTAGQLQAKLGSLSAEQRNAALATIFGADASRVAGILATEGAAGFDKMRDAVQTQGAAANAAKAYNDGFKGALDSFTSTVQTLGTDLGTKLLPPLTDFIRAITDPGKTIGGWVDAFNRAGPVIQGVTVFLGALALTIGVIEGLSALYIASFTIMTAVTGAFGVALAFVLSPLFLIAVAVAAVIAVGYLLWKHWDAVSAFAVKVWGGIGNAAGTAADWIVQKWSSVVSFFSDLPGRLGSWLGNVGGLLYNAGRDLIQGLLNGAGSLLGSIGRFMADRLPAALQGPFKKALGIHSPSTVFAGYGVNVVEGLANGITGSRGLLSGAMGQLDATMTVSPVRPDVGTQSQAALFTDQAPAPASGRNFSGPLVGEYNVYNQVDPERILRDLSRRVALA